MRSLLVVVAVVLTFSSASAVHEKVEEIAEGLLHVLDMKSTPNISINRPRDIPRYILSLYKEKLRKQRLSDSTGNPSLDGDVRILFPEDIDEKNNAHHLQFNLSASRRNETREVKNVELHLHVTSAKGASLKVGICRQIHQEKSSKGYRKDAIPILSREFQETTKNRWMVLNLTHSLISWFKDSRENLELWISSTQGLRIASEGKKKPFLAIFRDQSRLLLDKSENKRLAEILEPANEGRWNVTHLRHKRTKRSELNLCQHHRLFVRFRDLSWNNWIIAPSRFGFHYCEGSCPVSLTKDSNPTNHAILKNIIHRRINKKIPIATCVPTDLRSTVLLYYDADDAIVLKNVPGMVASACGCR